MDYVSIVFVNIMWGLSFIASKYAMGDGFTPFTLALWRYVLSSVLLVPVLWKSAGGLRLPKRGFATIFLSSLCGITFYFLFEYEGLSRTSPSSAALIVAAVPAFSLLWQRVAHHKTNHPLCYAGVAVSLIGVALVVGLGGEGDTAAGNFLMLGACLCWVFYLETSEKAQIEYGYSSTELTVWQSLIGLATLFPCMAVEQALKPESARFSIQAVGPMGWAAVAFLGAICSALCYIFYNRSIKNLSPARTALFLNLNPIAAMVADALMRGAAPSAAQMAGGLLILLSIFIVNRYMQKNTEGAAQTE